MSMNVDVTEPHDHQHTHKKGTAVKSSSKPRIRPASVSHYFINIQLNYSAAILHYKHYYYS